MQCCLQELVKCFQYFYIQAQFSQMRPVAMPPSVGPRMPMYPPGAPGMGQQFLFGQGPPAIIPPQVSDPDGILLFIG